MVNGVMSLWSRPYLDNGGGYSEDFVMLWALSIATARQHFANLILVTDGPGAKILEDFPYDVIDLSLQEEFIPQAAHNVWAAGKFIAIKKAVELGCPFVHFDGDMILRKYQSAFDQSLCAQCEESFKVSSSPTFEQRFLKEVYLLGPGSRLPYLPGYARFSLTRERQTPYNLGMVGGSDLEFLDRFSEDALKILNHPLNAPFWNTASGTAFSLFVEQYLFGALAAKEGKPVATLFPFSARGNEDFMRSIGYIHLWGDSKDKQLASDMIYQKVEEHFPWLFDVVKSLGLPRAVFGVWDGYGYYYAASSPHESDS